MIWFLYFSAMAIVNCELNARSVGDDSLYMRSMRARRTAAARGYRWWGMGCSAGVVTIGCMIAGIVVPLIFLNHIVTRLSRKNK